MRLKKKNEQISYVVFWPGSSNYQQIGKLYFWNCDTPEVAYIDIEPCENYAVIRDGQIIKNDVVVFLTDPIPEKKDGKHFYRKLVTQDAKIYYIYWDSFTSQRFEPLNNI